MPTNLSVLKNLLYCTSVDFNGGGGRKRSSQHDGRKWKVRAILDHVPGNADSNSNSAKNDCDFADNPIAEPQSPHLLKGG